MVKGTECVPDGHSDARLRDSDARLRGSQREHPPWIVVNATKSTTDAIRGCITADSFRQKHSNSYVMCVKKFHLGSGLEK